MRNSDDSNSKSQDESDSSIEREFLEHNTQAQIAVMQNGQAELRKYLKHLNQSRTLDQYLILDQIVELDIDLDDLFVEEGYEEEYEEEYAEIHEALYELCRALSQDKLLKILSLSSYFSDIIDDNIVKIIATSLKENDSLEVLKLYGKKNITDDGISALGEMLALTSSLKMLEVDGRSIGTDGCFKIATGLQTNQSLEELRFSWRHGLTDDHATDFSEAMAGNSTLRMIELNDCDLEPKALRSFVRSLNLNTQVSSLKVYESCVSAVECVETLDLIDSQHCKGKNKIKTISFQLEEGKDHTPILRRLRTSKGLLHYHQNLNPSDVQSKIFQAFANIIDAQNNIKTISITSVENRTVDSEVYFGFVGLLNSLSCISSNTYETNH